MMTWVTDGTGTHWVEVPPKKQRKSPRALRFAALKVGDQLILKPRSWWDRKIPIGYVVTDMWFDPVAGQHDEVAGRMVALRRIDGAGELRGSKAAHTLRGLASQGYHYAGQDIIGQRQAAAASPSVVHISRGRRRCNSVVRPL
jgi:hypothetical protein